MTKTNERTSPATAMPSEPAFVEVVNLLAVLSEAANRLAELEATANASLLEIIDEHKKEYAGTQEVYTRTESALEAACRLHPEWFKSAKSIKTPYGKVSFRAGSKLEVKDDEAAVRLIRSIYGEEKAKDFIRIQELLNLEALEALDDAELGRFMIKRVTDDSFTAAPAKVDFGKAVKAAAVKDNGGKPENN